MTPIEIMAVLIAAIALIKLITILAQPGALGNVANNMFKNTAIATAIFGALTAASGYYLLQTMNIVTIASVMFFTTMLFALGFAPHTKELIKLKDKILQGDVLRKNWLAFAIWIGLALWVLIEVFM